MSKKISITKVGVGSLAKLVGTVNAIIALVLGIIGSIVSSVGVISKNDYTIITDIIVAVGIAIFGVVVYPLILFVVGWLYGALIAIVWNALLGVSGGLQITTEEVKEAPTDTTKK